MTVVRPYRGVSAEQRRSDRRQRLVDACLAVVRSNGVAAATADGVCAEARLSKRYFYESFSDRDALLAAVLDERLFTALRRTIIEALTDRPNASLEERARVTLEALITAMDDLGIARIYVEAPGYPALQPRLRQAYDAYAELWLRHILRLDDPETRDHLAALVFVSGTTQAVINWLDGHVMLDRDELIAELAALGVVALARS